MELLESVKLGLHGLNANRLRSGLTMLGVIIGVWAVIVMISIGQGAGARMMQTIKSLGTNLLMVHPGQERRGPIWHGMGSLQTLTYDDALAIPKNSPQVLQVAPELSQPAQVKYRNQNTNTAIIGTTPEYPEVRNFTVQTGKFFTAKDVKSLRKVCVLGKTVVENLFGESSPVGKNIKIKGIKFKVIGVMTEKGQAGPMNPDDQILIPITTAQRRVFGVDYVRNINVQVVSAKKMDDAQTEIERLLRKRHQIGPASESDFTIRSQAEIIGAMEETSKTITLLLAGIASISLLVGGIGIMNIMLVSVTERTREIGIRKAVGAKKGDILKQFLIESMVLSLVGGAIGIGLGIIGSRLISKYTGWSTVISPESILLAFGFSAAVGIFFGIYPARKAAQLDPIQALRYE